MLSALFRLVATLVFCLTAIILIVEGIVGWHSQQFALHSVIVIWQNIAPASIDLAKQAVATHINANLWDQVIVKVIEFPAAAVAAVVAVVLLLFARLLKTIGV